ncbi:MAG: indolepyruvate ferredoxin oxidoreductase family protein [Immundisolibacterales bacterium]|nr:indolepyruvate ferredoxin oxidoreductase family protein [Immundisolibacterales bacterium]
MDARVKHSAVSLEDKYTLDAGTVYITGVQALVRLPMMQRRRDLAAGLDTAGYVSGYRGSPLGGYDNALAQAKPLLDAHHVRFHPGLNEDLAATAVWGSQHTEIFPGGKYDGVFAIWYGKGPGVDRSGDVLKHGNFAGAGANGGVLCIAGDDHGAKSSSMPHQSEQAFVAALMPVLNPSSVQEYLDLGLFGFAASRYSGCWIGFKAVSDTVESSASVLVDPHRLRFDTPADFERPEEGLNIDVEYRPIPYEARLLEQKLPALHAFARANPVDRVVISAPRPRIGIVTAGKAYLDLRQALDDLGIDEETAAEIGLSVCKLALTWPIEPEGMIRFASGLDEIIVVEEKRGFIEDQLTRLFYNRAEAPARIVGKRDETGRALLPERGELSAAIVARALAKRLRRPGAPGAEDDELDRRLVQRLARLDQIAAQAGKAEAILSRSPYFCSGCPHNTSTRVPDGSRAMAGIGCHGMAMFHPGRRTAYATHMGGEGVNWIGHSPFTEENHIFANLGDGTYDHSGLLAVRAAVAARVNITYKILYNDAVAMTGGQPLGGEVRVDAIARQMVAEGAERVVVMSDEPEKYPAGYLPRGVPVHHRDDLDRVQRELRETPGVTVLVYDQTCAAEKRRRRKRGLMADPPKRAFINHLVCEGCGDCSMASNCVSVQPLETRLGRKRRIDQSNCNKDFSCVKGFCPSFVTVHGGAVRKVAGAGAGSEGPDPFADLPDPGRPGCVEPYGILVTGIGGTGVITIGALLGMAAHVEGKGVTVLDSTGLSQKNGAVASHVRIAERAEDLHATRIGAGAVRLLLGCDMVTAAAPESLATVEQGVSRVVVNGDVTPPAAFVIDNTIDLGSRLMARQIQDIAGREMVDFVEATRLATALLGDSIATNLFMVGYAWQKGLVPLAAESIEAAIALNAVAVDVNRQAFGWGRLAAHDPARVWKTAGPLMVAKEDGAAGEDDAPESLDDIVEHRAAFLGDYQDAAWAERFRRTVERVRAAEAERTPGRDGLAEAVARNLFRLMSYKDEYEVARLYTSGEFEAGLRRQFEGDFRLRFPLAPPLIARRDPETGELRKREFGPWMFRAFRALAKMRRLRGTAFDLFGRTEERRMERRLIAEYEETVGEILDRLAPANHEAAVTLASVPETIKGFGHVKLRSVETARARRERLGAQFRAAGGPVPVPETARAAAGGGD